MADPVVSIARARGILCGRLVVGSESFMKLVHGAGRNFRVAPLSFRFRSSCMKLLNEKTMQAAA